MNGEMSDDELAAGSTFEIRPDPGDPRWHTVTMRVASSSMGDAVPPMRIVRGADAQYLTVIYILPSARVMAEGVLAAPFSPDAIRGLQLPTVIAGLRLLTMLFSRLRACEKNPQTPS